MRSSFGVVVVLQGVGLDCVSLVYFKILELHDSSRPFVLFARLLLSLGRRWVIVT
jgi:hypothetical protein